MTQAHTELQPFTQSQPSVPGYRPHRSQAQRHEHTAAVATRRTAPWTPLEDEELAACVSADDLKGLFGFAGGEDMLSSWRGIRPAARPSARITAQ